MQEHQVGYPKSWFLYGILGLALLNLLLFIDVLFWPNGMILSDFHQDLSGHFDLWRQFAFDQLRQGHLPLWDPHYLCGMPYLGGFESALLYPPNWLCLILPLNAATNWSIAVHVFLAGLFTYLWCFHRGLHPLACFLAGVTFMFSGAYYLHLGAGHLPNLCTMVWAPLIFLAVDGIREGHSRKWIFLGLFAVSMQVLAGHPQYVYFTAIMVVIYAVLNLKGTPNKWRFLAWTSFCYLGASILTAAQLWTGIEAYSECSRNVSLGIKTAASFSFPPENIITLIIPWFFGNLSTAPYWGDYFLWEVSLFIGITSFLLAFYGLGGPNPQKRRWAFTMVVLAFVFSLGANTPVYDFFYKFIPGFNGLRGICKFDIFVTLFLSLLTAYGMDRLLHEGKSSRQLVFSTLGIAMFLIVLGIAINVSAENGVNGIWGAFVAILHKQRSAMENFNLLTAGLCASNGLFKAGFVALILAILFYLTQKRRIFIYGIVLISVFELLLLFTALADQGRAGLPET